MKIKSFLISLCLIFSLSFPGVLNAEYFKDIVLTGKTGIWTDSRSYSSLTDAITAIGSSTQDVYIAKQEVVTDLVIPANIRLYFFSTGSIANTGQLTINTKDINAGNYRIFTGIGNIDFAPGSLVKSGWFNNFETALALTVNDTVTLQVTNSATLTASCALGNNVVLKWDSPGNILTIPTGITLTLSRNFDAGLYKTFNCVGTGKVVGLRLSRPEWFGFNPTALAATNVLSLNQALVAGTHIKVDSTGIIDVNDVATIVNGNTLIEGNSNLVIRQTVDAKRILYAKGLDNIHIRNLNLYGEGTYPGTSSTARTGIYLDACTNIEISNCWLRNFGNFGIDVVSSIYINIHDNKVEGTHLYSTPIAPLGNYQFGISTSNSDEILIHHNDISGTAQGIVSQGTTVTNISIHGNHIHDIPGQHGIYNTSSYTTVENNVIHDCNSVGIKQVDSSVQDAKSVLISGNVIYDVGQGILIGSQNTYLAKRFSVIGNNISDCRTSGIVVTSALSDSIISNNVITDCVAGYGIDFSVDGLTNNVDITGNVLKNIGWTGIMISGSPFNIRLIGNNVTNANTVSGSYYGIKVLNGTNIIVKDNIVTQNIGEITTYTITAGADQGTGYSVGDILTITQAGGSNGSIRVLTVGGSGEVATSELVTEGFGYTAANDLATVASPAGGTGCLVNITAVSASKQLYAFFAGASVTGLKVVNNTFENGLAHDVRLSANVDQWVGNTYSTLNEKIYARGDYQVGNRGFGSGAYSFATHSGAMGDYVLGTLPDNATIVKAWYETITAPASLGLATIAIGVATDDAVGIVAATAFNDAVFNPGYHDTLCTGASANFTTKTTAIRNVVLTIGGANLTAGVIYVYWEYVISQ